MKYDIFPQPPSLSRKAGFCGKNARQRDGISIVRDSELSAPADCGSLLVFGFPREVGCFRRMGCTPSGGCGDAGRSLPELTGTIRQSATQRVWDVRNRADFWPQGKTLVDAVAEKGGGARATGNPERIRSVR